MKRILATLLAVCMVLSMLVIVPFTATAAVTGADESNLGANEELVGYKAVTPTVAKGTYIDLEGVDGLGFQTEYEISTVAGLKNFAALVNGGETFEGVTVYLTADLDFSTLLSGVESTNAEIVASTAFNGIAVNGTPFKGTFDGQGYEITKVSLVNTVSGGDFGLFGQIEGATIKNLRLTGSNSRDTYGDPYEVIGGLNSTSNAASSMGAIAGRAIGSCTFYNIYSDYGVCYSQNNIYGGIVGSIGTLNVTDANAQVILENVENTGKVLCWNGKLFVGGLVGDVHNKTTLINCVNTAHVGAPNNTVGGLCYVGGLVGFVRGTAGSLSLTNCENRGKVYANAWFGGLVGTTTVASTFTNCTNLGVVEHTTKDPAASNKSIGGISGQITGKATLINCKNVADIITVNSDGAGGIVGIIYGAETIVENCLNSGNVKNFSKNGGGLMGYVEKSLTLTNSTNTGNINAAADGETINAGGLIGQANSDVNATTSVENCLNSGTVTSFYYNGGGMIGLANSQKAFILNNCTNSGKVSTKAGGQIAGGMVGQVANSVVRISDCTNTADISALRAGQFADGTAVGGGDAGGMAGRLNGNNHEIVNCTNNGAIAATGKPAYGNTSSNAGGIVGSSGGLAVVNCVNNGKVAAVGRRVAGIVGNSLGGTSNIWLKDCVNNAYVGSNDSNAGGIAGYLETNGTANGLLSDGVTVVPAGITVDGCINNGEIKTTSGNGSGIVSCVCYSAVINNCVNKGMVTASNAAGILVQHAVDAATLTISNCVNYGLVNDPNTSLEKDILDYKGGATYTSTNNVSYAAKTQWVGYQLRTNGDSTIDLRLVGSIDNINYNSVGFDISVSYMDGDTLVTKTLTKSLTKAYSALLAEGDPITAPAYRGADAKLFALVIEDLPTNVELTFNVTTYSLLTYDAEIVNGESATFTVTLG